jgi:hypothetical protein
VTTGTALPEIAVNEYVPAAAVSAGDGPVFELQPDDAKKRTYETIIQRAHFEVMRFSSWDDRV